MNAVSIDVDQLERLPAKALLMLLDRRKAAKRAVDLFASAIAQRPQLFMQLDEWGIEYRLDLNGADITLSFTADGERFAEMWALLRRGGWLPDTRPKAGDSSHACWWRQPGLPDLFFNFTSSVCRRVKVGTQMVEQPIYETQCGPSLPAIDDETIPAPPPALSASPDLGEGESF